MESEVASFSDEDADFRIQARVAELVKEYTIQPDQRTEVKVDEFGKTVLETKIVPNDLERNVELPPTRAGGKAKDEAHMTDEEKEHAAAYERGEDVSEVSRRKVDEEDSEVEHKDANVTLERLDMKPQQDKVVKIAPKKK